MRAIVFLLFISSASGQSARRYAELRRVIDRNTGFAHATRGVNMYTLYALRGCVTEKDITPYIPAVARNSAQKPKAMKNEPKIVNMRVCRSMTVCIVSTS